MVKKVNSQPTIYLNTDSKSNNNIPTLVCRTIEPARLDLLRDVFRRDEAIPAGTPPRVLLLPGSSPRACHSNMGGTMHCWTSTGIVRLYVAADVQALVPRATRPHKAERPAAEGTTATCDKGSSLDLCLFGADKGVEEGVESMGMHCFDQCRQAHWVIYCVQRVSGRFW